MGADRTYDYYLGFFWMSLSHFVLVWLDGLCRLSVLWSSVDVVCSLIHDLQSQCLDSSCWPIVECPDRLVDGNNGYSFGLYVAASPNKRLSLHMRTRASFRRIRLLHFGIHAANCMVAMSANYSPPRRAISSRHIQPQLNTFEGTLVIRTIRNSPIGQVIS